MLVTTQDELEALELNEPEAVDVLVEEMAGKLVDALLLLDKVLVEKELSEDTEAVLVSVEVEVT